MKMNRLARSGLIATLLLGAAARPALALTVDSVSPDHGPETGGIFVDISGTGFLPGCAAYFDGIPTFTSFLDSNTIRAVLPAGSGTVDVMVTDGFESGTLVDGFTYDPPPPTVTGVTPGNGPETGDTPVTITGTGFLSGAQAFFGGAAAGNIVVNGPTEITCTAPPGTGVADVAVQNAESPAVILSAAYTYDVVPPPTVSSVSPGNGPESGGTSVTVTGTGFVDGAMVRFGTRYATSVVVVGATQIACDTPFGTGTVAVQVRNADGDSDTLASGFVYDPPPTVGSIVPDHGPEAGGTTVSITGTGFVAGATVSIGGQPATSVSVNGSILIVCETPTGISTADVSVTNPDGQTGVLPGSFAYDYVPAQEGDEGGCLPGGTAPGCLPLAFLVSVALLRRRRRSRQEQAGT